MSVAGVCQGVLFANKNIVEYEEPELMEETEASIAGSSSSTTKKLSTWSQSFSFSSVAQRALVALALADPSEEQDMTVDPATETTATTEKETTDNGDETAKDGDEDADSDTADSSTGLDLSSPSSPQKKLLPKRKDWSIPILMLPSSSAEFQSQFPPDQFGYCVLHARIANALGYKTGDSLEFAIHGQKFSTPVTLMEHDRYDMVIDVQKAPGLDYHSISLGVGGTSKLTLKDGTLHELTHQELFDPAKTADGANVDLMGGILMEFTAASHKGMTGMGFTLHSTIDSANCLVINELVSGFRYCGHNVNLQEAHYAALVEGLVWASRMSASKVWACGDEETVLGQIRGAIPLSKQWDEHLMPYYHRAFDVMELLKAAGTQIEFLHDNDNTQAKFLANEAIASKKIMMECKWSNLNKQLVRD